MEYSSSSFVFKKTCLEISLFIFLLLLLVIAGVERNPGPTVMKSLFSFKAISGAGGKSGIHGLYKNQSSGQIEELSASSQQTPKDRKLPFGQIKTVTRINSDILRITNSSGDEIDLLWAKLSPQIIPGDSNLKQILFKSKEEKSSITFVSLLNKCILKYKTHSNSESNEKSSDVNFSPGSSQETASNEEKRPTETSPSQIENDHTRSSSEATGADTQSSNETTGEDIESKIQQIISEALFAKLNLEQLEIPEGVYVDKERMQQLRGAMKFEDKTQACSQP